eukprot:m.180669 g.180669  ORF g.180669 m.180669 type:complete len:357 (+) comp18429_c0_seq1:238-1308(+)
MWVRAPQICAGSFARCVGLTRDPLGSVPIGSVSRSFSRCCSYIRNLNFLSTRVFHSRPLSSSQAQFLTGIRSCRTSTIRCQHTPSSHDAVLFNIERTTGIATVTLNNSKKRNPLSSSVLQRLNDIVDDIESELQASRLAQRPSNVRVLIIKSTGPVFCSGHDFKDFTMDKGRTHHSDVLAACTQLNKRLQSSCPPTIAMVDGLATAAGCQLVCSCDLVVATETSRFCVPGSRNGGFCHTPGVSLSNKIHLSKALELLLLGDDLAAVEAARLGLVNKVVDTAEALDAVVDEWATKIANTSGYNTQMGKRCFYEHTQAHGIDAQYEVASAYMLDMFASPDQQEGIDAFFARRQPVWQT